MSNTWPSRTTVASKKEGSCPLAPTPTLPNLLEMADFRYVYRFIPCPSPSWKDSKFIGWPETHGLTRLVRVNEPFRFSLSVFLSFFFFPPSSVSVRNLKWKTLSECSSLAVYGETLKLWDREIPREQPGRSWEENQVSTYRLEHRESQAVVPDDGPFSHPTLPLRTIWRQEEEAQM